MRVVHVYKDVWPPVMGGVERHIDLLRRTLPGVRSDVLVCARTPLGRRRATPWGEERAVGQLGRVWAVPLAPTFPARLAAQRSELLHLHAPNPLGEIAALAAARGRPTVISLHADVVRQAVALPVYARLMRRVLDRAAAVVTGTAGLAATSPLLEGHRERVRVVPYGIDLDRLDAAHTSAADRDALRARLGTPLVLAVGRLVYYKGFEALIGAMDDVDASLVIVGDGPRREALEALARDRPRVSLAGPLPDAALALHLAAADLYVLPSTSRAESFGIATVEAQAAGLPAVVADAGAGSAESLVDGVTGLLIPPRDGRALAGAVRSLLGAPDRAAAMGAAARTRARARHAPEAQAAALAAIYAEALELTGGSSATPVASAASARSTSSG